MGLADYPRPAQDTGIGVHPTASTHVDLLPWIAMMVEMGAGWAKILDWQGSGLANARALLAAGIMPIVRLYRAAALPGGYEPVDLAVVAEYVRAGIRYFQLLCEPNLDVEWADGTFWGQGGQYRIEMTANAWVVAAQYVVAVGGIPITPPMAPGGNHDDRDFFRRFIRWLLGHNYHALLRQSAIGLHNYPLNHPLDYSEDSNGFLKFRWYHQILREELALVGYDQAEADEIPILALEGGPIVGNADDSRYPAITPESHRDNALATVRYMRTAEPYLLCCMFWLLANHRAGQPNEMWERHAWVSDLWPGGQLPAVAALQNEPKIVRGQNMAYQVGEGFRKVEGLVGPWREDETHHFPGTDHQVSLAVGERGVAVWVRRRNETYAFTTTGEVWGDRGNYGNSTMVRLRGQDA